MDFLFILIIEIIENEDIYLNCIVDVGKVLGYVKWWRFWVDKSIFFIF